MVHTQYIEDSMLFRDCGFSALMKGKKVEDLCAINI